MACRRSASRASSGAMPQPSSTTRTRAVARRLDLHVDPPRAGVDGVLDQLLHHGGGALDHLAGRDLVGQRRRKHANLRSRRGGRAVHHDEHYSKIGSPTGPFALRIGGAPGTGQAITAAAACSPRSSLAPRTAASRASSSMLGAQLRMPLPPRLLHRRLAVGQHEHAARRLPADDQLDRAADLDVASGRRQRERLDDPVDRVGPLVLPGMTSPNGRSWSISKSRMWLCSTGPA